MKLDVPEAGGCGSGMLAVVFAVLVAVVVVVVLVAVVVVWW